MAHVSPDPYIPCPSLYPLQTPPSFQFIKMIWMNINYFSFENHKILEAKETVGIICCNSFIPWMRKWNPERSNLSLITQLLGGRDEIRNQSWIQVYTWKHMIQDPHARRQSLLTIFNCENLEVKIFPLSTKILLYPGIKSLRLCMDQCSSKKYNQ